MLYSLPYNCTSPSDPSPKRVTSHLVQVSSKSQVFLLWASQVKSSHKVNPTDESRLDVCYEKWLSVGIRGLATMDGYYLCSHIGYSSPYQRSRQWWVKLFVLLATMFKTRSTDISPTHTHARAHTSNSVSLVSLTWLHALSLSGG